MKRIKSVLENKISKTEVPISGTKNEDRISMFSILLLTLAPLYLLVIIGVIVLALVMLDRYFITLTNFILQQIIFIAIIIIGMAIAIIAYSLSVIHAHRKIGMWRQDDHKMQANVGLLVLAIVASLMILPIILAFSFH
jgi:hypothetical protein